MDKMVTTINYDQLSDAEKCLLAYIVSSTKASTAIAAGRYPMATYIGKTAYAAVKDNKTDDDPVATSVRYIFNRQTGVDELLSDLRWHAFISIPMLMGQSGEYQIVDKDYVYIIIANRTYRSVSADKIKR